MKKNPVVHFEMPYKDAKRVADFYSKAFGWGMVNAGAQMGNYVVATTTDTDEHQMVKTPGTINGGFWIDPSRPQMPSVVVSVENIQASMRTVTEAGGKVMGEPVDIPTVGKYVSFTDTEGNILSLLQPEMNK